MVIAEFEFASGSGIEFTNPSSFIISQSNVNFAISSSSRYIVSKDFNETKFLDVGQPYGCIASDSISRIEISCFP